MHSIPELIEDIKAGKMVLLVDDEDRENEGDLVLAGQFATPAHINFMAKEARGLICLAMSTEQSNRLGLTLMVGEHQNHSPNKTAFTVSIEAREGISTGISAADRAKTIQVASRPEATTQSIITPGHIFPIKAKPGGVLQRSGHTEGSVDLMKLAGLYQSAVICEVMNDDGTMARYPELIKFAEKHNLKIGSIESLIEYRLNHESHIEVLHKEEFKVVEQDAVFEATYVKDMVNDRVHYALKFGEWKKDEVVPVRVHVDRGPEDLINSKNKEALNEFLSFCVKEKKGVLVVLRHANFFADPLHQRDHREFGIGAQILKKLGAENLALVTNSKTNLAGLSAFGVEIKEMISYNKFFKGE